MFVSWFIQKHQVFNLNFYIFGAIYKEQRDLAVLFYMLYIYIFIIFYKIVISINLLLIN